jgi:hypothetical protein
VNFTHDTSEAFEGVLWSYRGGWLILKDVTPLKAGRALEKIQGDVVLHRSTIAFLQVLP